MLVEMAVFDAYGAGFEFVHSEFLQEHHKMGHYVQHPRHKRVKPGMYTDDTQMAIALAELLINRGKPEEWNLLDVAHAFVKTFKRDPREGYSEGFFLLLRRVSTNPSWDGAKEFLSKIQPHSSKNGGAMRAGPIGLLPNIRRVEDIAMFQASLTHATRVGMGAAAAAALMVHYFHYGLGAKKDLPEWLDAQVPGFHWDQPYQEVVGTRATDAVSAALWAIVRSDTLTDVLRLCVGYGGDTDTVAAIAACAASRSDEIAQFLPVGLHKGLENGKYGREFLADLDANLLAKFPGSSG